MLNNYDSFPLLLDYVDITRFTVSFQVNQSFCLLATNFFVYVQPVLSFHLLMDSDLFCWSSEQILHAFVLRYNLKCSLRHYFTNKLVKVL